MQPHSQQIVDHYDQLAENYDALRFGNSYGRYVDAQERAILKTWLRPVGQGAILDFACGTGRLLEFATHGLDPSPKMTRVAQEKFPAKEILCGTASDIAKFKIKFDAIFCFHLFMHLPRAEIAAIVEEFACHLRPGGLLIFDAPSQLRRRLTGFQATGWHGGTALNRSEIAALTRFRWRIKATRGILLFPIHRAPEAIRPILRPFEQLAGITPLKALSSYLVYCSEKRS